MHGRRHLPEEVSCTLPTSRACPAPPPPKVKPAKISTHEDFTADTTSERGGRFRMIATDVGVAPLKTNRTCVLRVDMSSNAWDGAGVLIFDMFFATEGGEVKVTRRPRWRMETTSPPLIPPCFGLTLPTLHPPPTKKRGLQFIYLYFICIIDRDRIRYTSNQYNIGLAYNIHRIPRDKLDTDRTEK